MCDILPSWATVINVTYKIKKRENENKPVYTDISISERFMYIHGSRVKHNITGCQVELERLTHTAGLLPSPGTGTVMVTVSDENDVSPRFSRKEWLLTVHETVALNRTIAFLTIDDPDVTNEFAFRVSCCNGVIPGVVALFSFHTVIVFVSCVINLFPCLPWLGFHLRVLCRVSLLSFELCRGSVFVSCAVTLFSCFVPRLRFRFYCCEVWNTLCSFGDVVPAIMLVASILVLSWWCAFLYGVVILCRRICALLLSLCFVSLLPCYDLSCH